MVVNYFPGKTVGGWGRCEGPWGCDGGKEGRVGQWVGGGAVVKAKGKAEGTGRFSANVYEPGVAITSS